MKVTISILLTIAAINQVLSFECGLENYESQQYGGKKIPNNKYPWLALIRATFKNAKEPHECVGVLIDNQHVITVAQCVVENGKGIPFDRLEVHLDAASSFQDEKSQFKAFHAYFDTKFDDNSDRDFSILKLAKPVEFSQTISPICLPKSDGNLKQLTTVGWNFRSKEKFSLFKSKSKNPKNIIDIFESNNEYINSGDCQRMNSEYMMTKKGYPLSEIDQFMKSNPQFRVSEVQMCARNKENSADTCNDLAGAPLMNRNSDGRWVLVGILSSTWDSCGTSDVTSFANIFARVTAFENEIKKAAPNSVWVDV